MKEVRKRKIRLVGLLLVFLGFLVAIYALIHFKLYRSFASVNTDCSQHCAGFKKFCSERSNSSNSKMSPHDSWTGSDCSVSQEDCTENCINMRGNPSGPEDCGYGFSFYRGKCMRPEEVTACMNGTSGCPNPSSASNLFLNKKKGASRGTYGHCPASTSYYLGLCRSNEQVKDCMNNINACPRTYDDLNKAEANSNGEYCQSHPSDPSCESPQWY